MRIRHFCRAAIAACFAFLSLPALAGELTLGADGEFLTVPVPGSERPLFRPIEEALDQACPTKIEVIRHYIASRSSLKSDRVKLLGGSLPQAFADVWRRRLHMGHVAVSAVVGQPLDLRRLGGGPTVDVTEFGADGCAISRTLMPWPIWADLIRAASGTGI